MKLRRLYTDALFTGLCLVALISVVAAQQPHLMSTEKEIALAKSAGPPAIAAEAAIYVLSKEGYELVEKGSNGCACLVGRGRPDTLEPMCFDPEGARTILPKVLDAARYRAEGLSPEQVQARIAEGFRDGVYQAPGRPGITYMLSRENRVFNGQRVISFAPHVMFFAPYLKNADIGSAGDNPYLPWILNEGSPHAYVIVVVKDEALAVCESG